MARAVKKFVPRYIAERERAADPWAGSTLTMERLIVPFHAYTYTPADIVWIDDARTWSMPDGTP